MKNDLSRTTRRVVSLGLLIGLISSLWLGLVEPVVDYLDTAAVTRGISLRALKRNRALLQRSSAIQAAEASVEQSSRWRNFYDAPRAESATLQLEADVRSALKDSNNPTSMVAEPASVRGSVTRIAVRVTLLMRVDQLAEALDRLQKQPRQLRIESLTIQAPEFQNGQPNPVLNVQAEITAMMTAHGTQAGATT
jgi:Type II secretion system (T2SS), protein M subtype b